MGQKEDEDYIKMLEDELQAQKSPANISPYSAAMFGGQNKQNLVEFQLDFKPELQDILRLLRSDVLIRDEEGNEHWIQNPNKDRILLNDLGVNDIIKKIILLINKNKVLSNYKPEEVQARVKMISHEVRTLIYKNYDYYGMDNEYKMNNYTSLVVDLNDAIEAAYRRALNGGTGRDLNQTRLVQQTDPIMPNGGMNYYPQMQQQRRGFISSMMPWNWKKN